MNKCVWGLYSTSKSTEITRLAKLTPLSPTSSRLQAGYALATQTRIKLRFYSILVRTLAITFAVRPNPHPPHVEEQCVSHDKTHLGLSLAFEPTEITQLVNRQKTTTTYLVSPFKQCYGLTTQDTNSALMRLSICTSGCSVACCQANSIKRKEC